jgi:hypothetical protein
LPINIADYPHTIDAGLKANTNYNIFLYRFKKDGITKRGIIDYSSTSWDKRTRISQAKIELLRKKRVFKYAKLT